MTKNPVRIQPELTRIQFNYPQFRLQSSNNIALNNILLLLLERRHRLIGEIQRISYDL